MVAQTLVCLLFLAASLEAADCKTCHLKIWESWKKTGMARSFSLAGNILPGAFDHSASKRSYRILKRGASYYVRREQAGGTNVVEKRIDYAVGSGDHARSYLHRGESGVLVELPVTWYAEGGGHWGMSPGFDRPDHLDFRRRAKEDCFFCHTSSGLDAIGCERCHGPGEAHAKAPSRGNIVNPARLDPQRAMDVCMQCHLQTTSRMLPHAIRRYDRTPFSFRPGEPLTDYLLHFDHTPRAGYGAKFEVNSSAYRLRQSRCFLESRGRLTCITCHPPHAAAADYQRACRSCHAASHGREALDCVGCHMPKRRSEDATHVVVTDHRISRRFPRDLLKPLAESRAIYQGAVQPYYPRDPDPLYLALAQVVDASNLAEGVRQLEAAVVRLRPAQPEFYYELAEALRRSGKPASAATYYAEAIRRRPDFSKAYDRLGDVLLRSGDLPRACGTLEQAVRIDTLDADARNTLAVAYGQQGKLDASIRLLREATSIDPDFPLAWLNLGVSLEQAGDRGGAEKAYREALRVQPDFTRARDHLANLLVAR